MHDDDAPNHPIPTAHTPAPLLPEIVEDDDLPPHIAEAFRVWLVTPNDRGQRSIKQTSRITGHTVGTLQSWHSRHRWTHRARQLARDANAASYSDAMEAAASLRVPIITKLATLAFAGRDERVQVQALSKLADLAGLQAPTMPISHGDEDDGGAVDPAHLAALVAAGDIPSLLRLSRGESLPPPTHHDTLAHIDTPSPPPTE